MVSNKERLFENHICKYLHEQNGFIPTEDKEIDDRIFNFITGDILSFIKNTQKEKYDELVDFYGDDSDE